MSCFCLQESFGAVGDEVDAVLILEGDLFAVCVEDGSFIRMRRPLELVRALPHVQKAAAIFRLHVTTAATFGFGGRSEMPLADQVGGVPCLAQLACQRGQRWIDGSRVMPHAGLRGVAACHQYRSRRRAHRLIADSAGEVRSRARPWRRGWACACRRVLTVGAYKVGAELIGKIDDDVRPAGSSGFGLPQPNRMRYASQHLPRLRLKENCVDPSFLLQTSRSQDPSSMELPLSVVRQLGV